MDLSEVGSWVATQPMELCQCIEVVMPADRPFTCAEIGKALEALDPDPTWELQSIKNQGTVRSGRQSRSNLCYRSGSQFSGVMLYGFGSE